MSEACDLAIWKHCKSRMEGQRPYANVVNDADAAAYHVSGSLSNPNNTEPTPEQPTASLLRLRVHSGHIGSEPCMAVAQCKTPSVQALLLLLLLLPIRTQPHLGCAWQQLQLLHPRSSCTVAPSLPAQLHPRLTSSRQSRTSRRQWQRPQPMHHSQSFPLARPKDRRHGTLGPQQLIITESLGCQRLEAKHQQTSISVNQHGYHGLNPLTPETGTDVTCLMVPYVRFLASHPVNEYRSFTSRGFPSGPSICPGIGRP
jgi:hypothetical protein